MSAKVAIIFGAGKRVGTGVAKKLQQEGFKVAIGARNPNVEQAKADGFYPFKVDLAAPDTIPGAFAEVEKALGGAASVVVYNAAALTFPPGGAADPLSLPYSSFVQDVQTTGLTNYSVLQNAVKGFKTLPASTLCTFITTGNILPFHPIPQFVSLGVGKSISAHLAEVAAKAYNSLGYRFYFASEVDENGGPQMNLDAAGHGEVFYSLHQRPDQRKTNVLFTKNKIVN